MNRKTFSILALSAVILTVLALWFTSRAVTPKDATWEDVVAEARLGEYKLITTEELAQAYQKDRSRVFLVDTRQDWEFKTGHMKGAVNFPIEPTWWSRWRKASDLETLLGPDKNRFIVFY